MGEHENYRLHKQILSNIFHHAVKNWKCYALVLFQDFSSIGRAKEKSLSSKEIRHLGLTTFPNLETAVFKKRFERRFSLSELPVLYRL